MYPVPVSAGSTHSARTGRKSGQSNPPAGAAGRSALVPSERRTKTGVENGFTDDLVSLPIPLSGVLAAASGSDPQTSQVQIPGKT